MPCLRLFRGRQDKDRHDEAIRDAESAFRFPSLGPRSAGGGGDDHRNDRRSQVALSFVMVIRAREPGVPWPYLWGSGDIGPCRKGLKNEFRNGKVDGQSLSTPASENSS